MKLPGLEQWVKPNVRLLFLPDPDHVIFEVDLSQADAQVVAWEANDKSLMDFFLRKLADPDNKELDLHANNALDVYGPPVTDHKRQMCKHGVHAFNFGAKPPTVAKKLDMNIRQSTHFHDRWFYLHPGIHEWHNRTEMQLMQTRTITNKFGYRRIFFERLNNLLPEALAWIPQSTTVNVIDKGLNRMCAELPEAIPLLQVHDSIVGQFHRDHWPWIRPEIKRCFTIEVPYEPISLVIGTSFSASLSSWGNASKVSWAAGPDFPIPA